MKALVCLLILGSKHAFHVNKVSPKVILLKQTLRRLCFTGSVACVPLFFHSYMSTVSRTLVNKAVRETDKLPGWMSDTSSVVWSPSVSTNHSLL